MARLGGLLGYVGGLPFDELYETRLDWIIRTRKIPLDSLLDLPVSALDAMMGTIVQHEKDIRGHMKKGRR